MLVVMLALYGIGPAGGGTHFLTIDFFGELSIAGDLKKTAFIGGLHAGYNWQFAPTWVVGIEGDMSWTDAKGEFTTPWTRLIGGVVGADRPDAHTSMSIGPDWIATVRGELAIWLCRTRWYFTGGGAWANVQYEASAANEPPSTYLASTSFSKTASGYVLGGGFEWALWSSHWSLRAEYLYYHLNTSNLGHSS